MRLLTEPYRTQATRWPKAGRHILAQYDADTIVVYQAYRPAIGYYAAEHGCFGGEFSFDRMSWIKPSFLWMMYRSGWGTKENQEVTLAVRLRRSGFDYLLREAVHSTFVPEVYWTHADWQEAVAKSAVRLQWDPDHHPSGAKQDRRAVQLGLRGEALARFGREWLVEIEDISPFVEVQKQHVEKGSYELLYTPQENIYPVNDPAVARKLGVDSPE